MFLGEAPGSQEDVTGLPFQGEAGRVFNQTLSFCKTRFHFEITNLLGCRPTKWGRWEFQVVNRTPTKTEIDSCRPRLVALTQEVQYDGIVYLGKEAKDFKVRGLPGLSLLHPAAILRMEYKLYSVKESALKLDRYVSSLIEERKQSTNRK